MRIVVGFTALCWKGSSITVVIQWSYCSRSNRHKECTGGSGRSTVVLLYVQYYYGTRMD